MAKIGDAHVNVYLHLGDNDHATAIRQLAFLRQYSSDLEKELRRVKGPCSSAECGLYFAHIGPCNG